MNQSAWYPLTEEELIIALDAYFDDVVPLSDEVTIPRIAIAFCTSIWGDLDVRQRAGIEAALGFLDGRDQGAHAEYLSIFAELISPSRASLSHEPKIVTVRNRLVWCALSLKGGLDGYACEFVIGLGIEAGLDIRDVTDIVVRSIPGFAAWLSSNRGAQQRQ